MHRFIYNGRNSRDFGIVLSGEDTWRKAVPDLERKQIPGRNGDLVLSNQRYNNVKLKYHAGIIHDFEKNYTALSNFLLSSPGYHRLEDSYHPEYYRMALLEGDIEPKLTAYHHEGEIDLTFSCMPQMYLKSGEQQKLFTQGGSINNPTLYVARPLLRVYGIGRFAINDDIVNISYAEVFTDIDCELEDAYKGAANWNAYIELSNNEFPKLNPGANQIALMTGIENSAKIVSVTYDVLLERYEAMTVGDVRTSLTDTMRAISEEINRDTPSVSAIKNAISHATNILSGGLGGYVVINTNADGQPVEILAMNTADITSATYILRLSKEGISVSTTGYTGPYETVMQLSGSIGAEFLRGVLDAALVKKGSLADKAANISWNMVTGAFKGSNMEITTLDSESVTTESMKSDQTDAGELTATTVEAESVEADSVDADVVGAQTVIAESIEATSVSADTLSSGDGLTGTFHIPGTADALGFTISVRNGIITGLVEDDPPPPDPEEPDPEEPDPVEPDPQGPDDPDPEEPTDPDPSEEGE